LAASASVEKDFEQVLKQLKLKQLDINNQVVYIPPLLALTLDSP